jgi:hypothetical protein
MIGSIPSRHLNILAIALTAVWLTGCATATKAPDKYEEGHSPEVGIRSSAAVGEVMVSEYNYTAEEIGVLLSASEGSMMWGRPSVPANSKLVKTTSSKGAIFCYPYGGSPSPCFQDEDGDGNFDYAYNYGNFGVVAPIGGIDPIPYRIADATLTDGFKYELVYQGVDDNTLRISYREYSESLARPAFQQDLTYTLAEGDTPVSFRSVRLTIHSAGNNEVEYTVDSSFE